MRPKNWIDIEDHKLSNGQSAVVSKIGKKYRYALLDPNEGIVDVLHDVSKAEAMDKLADILKADVMDELI